MKLNYVRRISAYVSTFYHSEYITLNMLNMVPGNTYVSKELKLEVC